MKYNFISSNKINYIFRNFFLKIKKNEILVKNFSYLSALQIFNLLIPFITYPYLIRILGIEEYGLLAFSQAIVSYFALLVGYGFNIIGTIEVSKHRTNKHKLSEVLTSIFISKLILLIISFVLLYFSLIFLEKSTDHKLVFYLSMWFCIYDLIFPGWYFQGLEKMKWVTIISLIMRLSTISLIFLFIKLPSDYIYVPVFNGLGAMLAGCTAQYLIIFRDHIKFTTPKFHTIKYYFSQATPIFISNLSTTAVTSTAKVLIGIKLGMSEIAYFDIAEKLLNLLKMPQFIFTQILLPKISKDKDISFVLKLRNYSFFFNLSILIVTIFLLPNILTFLGGSQLIPGLSATIIMLMCLPFSALMSVYSVQLLISFGFSMLYTKIIILSGISYLSILFLLDFTIGYTLITFSTTTLLVEVFTVIISHLACVRYVLPKYKK